MSGDGILDGDYILCQQKDHYDESDILIVVVDSQETTLKRVVDNQDGTVSLIASNPQFATQDYCMDRISIQAVYRGLIRVD